MVYSLQILRALSAISILIYHVLVNQYGQVPAVRVFSAGIVVFFIISGYIIARSTEKTSDPLLSSCDASSGFIRSGGRRSPCGCWANN